MTVRSYLADPVRRDEINTAIRRAFLRRRTGGGTVARILIIEDDPLKREMLSRTLAQADHETYSPATRKQALELCMQQVFDLIVIGVSSPASEGFETIAALRRWMRDARILAVAWQPAPAGGAAAIASGATRCLVRPFDTVQLLEAVDSLAHD